MDIYNALIIGISIVAVIIITKILNIPLRKIVKLVINSLLGGILIFCINQATPYLGVHIGLNVYTSVFVGIFGIPGVILLILLNF